MRRILRLMTAAAGPYAARFHATLRISAVAAIVQAASYAVFIPLLAELSRHPVRAERVWLWIGVLAILVAIEAVLRVREVGFTYDYWHLVTEDARLRVGQSLRSMPHQELARRAAGDLTTVVGANVTNAATAVSSLATLFVQFVMVPVVLGVVILAVDWRLGLVLAAAAVAATPLVGRVRRLSNIGFRRVDEADAAASSRIVEYVQGLPVFKATGQAGSDSPRIATVLARQQEEMSAEVRSVAAPLAVLSLLVQVAVVALVAIGAALVLDARLPVALLAAVVVTAARFAEPLSMVPTMGRMFEMSDAGLSRVGDVLDVQPMPVSPGGREPASFDIRFTGVTFTYDGHTEPALRDVDLTVPERSLTALVGPSGSGKTTVTRLITRFADPQAGVVTVGGVDLRTLEPDLLLRHVAVVFQDVYLFDDTIRANIAMSRPDAPDADVEAAARAANVHEFIDRLPHGYETRVGEIGSALSGGERQRISIARAILKDAPIVLLDEPTAALDAESEVVVQQAIDSLVADKTVIVIAHRLSTVVGADQILVLEGGRIVQRGTHADLLARPDGRYARMWAAQVQARAWHVSPTVP